MYHIRAASRWIHEQALTLARAIRKINQLAYFVGWWKNSQYDVTISGFVFSFQIVGTSHLTFMFLEFLSNFFLPTNFKFFNGFKGYIEYLLFCFLLAFKQKYKMIHI